MSRLESIALAGMPPPLRKLLRSVRSATIDAPLMARRRATRDSAFLQHMVIGPPSRSLGGIVVAPAGA